MAPSGIRTHHLLMAIICICVLGMLAFLFHTPGDVPIKQESTIIQEPLSNVSHFVQETQTPCSTSVCVPCPTSTNQPPSAYDPKKYLLGNPTPSFRDNLRPDVKYITAWIPGGFTNDVMGLSNLIYVAQQGGRIPVLPAFSDFRDQWEAGHIPFGQVFDVPRLSESLQMPILEWRDVKDFEIGRGRSPDPLGCWSVWAPYDGRNAPRPNFLTGQSQLSLDLSYTPIMEPVKLMDINVTGDPHVNLYKLVKLSHHDGYLEAIKNHEPIPYPDFPNLYPPDEHLMCIDFLYWASILIPYEWETSYSPGWKIAKHIRWNPKLTSLAEEYLMRLFHVSRKEDIPPFISLHVRRRDFAGWCGDILVKDCFAPLEAYEVRVREIQDELKVKLGTHNPLKVVVTSDELDSAWWEEVRQRGWLFVDHGPGGENTAIQHGLWYIPLLDAVIQSMGTGFVGTDRSTMSLLASRRVEEWNGGVTRGVKWGFPGADNH